MVQRREIVQSEKERVYKGKLAWNCWEIAEKEGKREKREEIGQSIWEIPEA